MRINATGLMNLTSDGTIDGNGRSSYGSASGPGTPDTSGCSWNTGDYGRDRAASHGGLGGKAGDKCLCTRAPVERTKACAVACMRH